MVRSGGPRPRRLVPRVPFPPPRPHGSRPRRLVPGSRPPGLLAPRVFPSPRSSRPPGLSCAPNLRMRPIYQAHPQISGAGMCGRANDADDTDRPFGRASGAARDPGPGTAWATRAQWQNSIPVGLTCRRRTSRVVIGRSSSDGLCLHCLPLNQLRNDGCKGRAVVPPHIIDLS
ncbi:hypothetical protein SDC9_104437 [bioreactor metagenome]|uniref:Uncharacterized protein n=1 Tax=bioreactor metagenome TaxID=1076179 RepID=A0A645AWJ4_9ZZZZ